MDSPYLVEIATRAEGEGGKHEMWAGQFYSRGAYTFLRHSKRKVTALRLHSRAYSRHFTHTMTKNNLLDSKKN